MLREVIDLTGEKPGRRKQIPSTVRMTLWDKTFPRRSVGRCFVCNTEITHLNFQAGHINSVKNGGSDNISNLKTICSSCNQSMGTMNLMEFKYKNFDQYSDDDKMEICYD
jgi:5-methylcytosine-specific restriction endonuclease McrA